MKSITIDGRLGKDAEVLETKNGIPYVKFSVANNSYSMGEIKTEWFDVTSFDKNVIENRVKALMKGRYVIVTGTPLSKVHITQDRKVYLNQYITAISIETPSFGKRNDDNSSEAQRPKVSTYTEERLQHFPVHCLHRRLSHSHSPKYSLKYSQHHQPHLNMQQRLMIWRMMTCHFN